MLVGLSFYGYYGSYEIYVGLNFSLMDKKKMVWYFSKTNTSFLEVFAKYNWNLCPYFLNLNTFVISLSQSSSLETELPFWVFLPLIDLHRRNWNWINLNDWLFLPLKKVRTSVFFFSLKFGGLIQVQSSNLEIVVKHYIMHLVVPLLSVSSFNLNINFIL